MEALFAQFSFLANEALDDKDFDPSRIEQLLDLFERESHASWSAAEAQHQKAALEAESSMKEAEDCLESLMEAAMDEFRSSCDEMERCSERELSGLVGAADAARKRGSVLGAAAAGAADKYVESALASAVAATKAAFSNAKIKKVHPSS